MSNVSTGDVYHDAILYNMPATHLPANNLNQATALGLEVVRYCSILPQSHLNFTPFSLGFSLLYLLYLLFPWIWSDLSSFVVLRLRILGLPLVWMYIRLHSVRFCLK